MIDQQDNTEWTDERIDTVTSGLMESLVRNLQSAPLSIPAVLGIMLLTHTTENLLVQLGVEKALEFAMDLQSRANEMVANMEALANGAQEKPSDTLN